MHPSPRTPLKVRAQGKIMPCTLASDYNGGMPTDQKTTFEIFLFSLIQKLDNTKILKYNKNVIKPPYDASKVELVLLLI